MEDKTVVCLIVEELSARVVSMNGVEIVTVEDTKRKKVRVSCVNLESHTCILLFIREKPIHIVSVQTCCFSRG